VADIDRAARILQIETASSLVTAECSGSVGKCTTQCLVVSEVVARLTESD
jgi:hypothetical protein